MAWSQQGRLQLDDLVAEAVANNPEIAAARKRFQAAMQRPSQQTALPDLVFTPGYASNGHPWPGAGLGVWPTSHVGATLSQEFPFPGKRTLRGGIALKEAEAAAHEYELARLSVISRLKTAYHHLQYAYTALDLLTRNRDLLRKLRRLTETPYFAGQAAQQAQVSVLETRLARMEQEKRSREGEINKLCKRPLVSPLARPEDMRPPKLAMTLDELLARAAGNAPLLRREQRLVERNELALKLARKEYYPDYELSAGYFAMGRMPDLYDFRVSIRLPLYWRKRAGGVAEQRYSLEQARSNYEATSQDLLFEIRNEHQKAQTAFRLIAAYADTVLPEVNRALESYLAAYEAGTVDFMAVQASFMSAVEAELGYYGEILDCYLALVRLEELTGISPG